MSIEWILIMVIGVVGMLVQGRMQSVFGRYSREMLPGGLTGREVAERMLRENGISDVRVVSTRGHLTDNYNPTDKTINLSESVYGSRSISAAAVAAHETGHAIQDAEGYGALRLRSALVPVINYSSRWSFVLILVGILVINVFPIIFWLGIGMIGMSAIFSVVTLPVEINASDRALKWLGRSGLLSETGKGQAREALKWAALTYVVAALSAIATLIYYVGIARRN